MKIPETSANVGAYYGNDENGQWQPNGVIVETGGAVGGGDARPLYPIHVPRNHIPGYVMAGAYYASGGVAYAPPPAPADDFADYMWMEHEEEFDKQVMQQLEEEALMEQCIEAMLEDEQRERARPANGHTTDTTSNGTPLSLEETVSRSTLNPLAAEFVPTFRPQTQPPSENTVSEEKQESSPAEAERLRAQSPPPAAPTAAPADDEHSKAEEEPQPPQLDPPEVSAADLQTDKDRRHEKKRADSNKRQQERKPQPRSELKKRPQAAKSESRVQPQPRKKEVKGAKSEPRVSESALCDVTPAPAPVPAPASDTSQPTQPPAVEDPTIPKPINYAAAAKANKPKKPSGGSEKTPPLPPTDKPKRPTEKPAAKPEKPAQRKYPAK